MCLNCCNNIELILKHTAKMRGSGMYLGVSNDMTWKKALANSFKRTDIEECRSVCYKEYFIEEEEVEFVPPNDVQLGRVETNPAYDCRDVMENGPGAESGEYFIKSKKGAKPIRVYCDMQTEDGGWT